MKNYNKYLLIILCIAFSSTIYSQTILLEESFEQNSEGYIKNYIANTFDAKDGDYIDLFSNNPVGSIPHLIKPTDGEDMLLMEDVDDIKNPLRPDDISGYVLFKTIDVSGYSTINISIDILTDSVKSTFDFKDKIQIEYAWDDNIATIDDADPDDEDYIQKINTGTYTIASVYRGGYGSVNPITGNNNNSRLIKDQNLDSFVNSSDIPYVELNYIATTDSFELPVTGTKLSIRIVADLDGSEEIGFDNFIISGVTDGTLGIDEVNAFDKVSVYPNPIKNELFINGDNIQKVSVHDITGKLIKTQDTTNKIDFSNINSGSYFVKISSKEGVITKKVIKL